MKIPDELLSAFVNGELDAAERQRIELAMARDRRVAQRVARQRALHSRLQVALDEVAQSPTPARTALPIRFRSHGSAQIIDLARVRALRAQAGPHRRIARSPRFIVATSLLIGAVLGAGAMYLGSGALLMRSHHGALLTSGDLARALDEQLSGSAVASSSIQVSATYRSRSGTYCRSFSIAAPQTASGLACRIRDQWQLQSLLNGASRSTLADFDKNVGGSALSGAAEIQLRARGWK